MQPTETANTRERLLDAASQLIWERGFQGTSVDDLCQRAKARKGSFYHFFPSKAGLVIAAIEQSWTRRKKAVFDPVFASRDSGLSQIATLAARLNDVQLNTKAENGALLGCPFGSLGQEMACQDDAIRNTLQTIFDESCGYLEAALERAVAAGELAPGDNRQRAKALFALFQGAALLAKVANDPAVFRYAVAGLNGLVIR